MPVRVRNKIVILCLLTFAVLCAGSWRSLGQQNTANVGEPQQSQDKSLLVYRMDKSGIVQPTALTCSGTCLTPLTAGQVAAVAYNGGADWTGFRGGGLVNSIAIAKAESQFVVNAINTANTNGSADYGLWQINSTHGYNSSQLLTDASYNARAAYQVSNASSTNPPNWCPWVTYWNNAPNAAFVSNLGLARSAAQTVDITVIRGINDRVISTTNGVRVRSTAGGTEVRQVNSGATGTVIEGYVVATLGTCGNGFPRTYVWWKVRWDDGGSDGWSAEDFMSRTANSSPTLSISAVTPATTQTRDWDQTVTYTISVVDNSGSPVSGSTVNVSDSIRSFSTFTSPTNSSGQTIYTTTVPSGKADGTYDVAFTATKSGYSSSSSVIRQVQVRHLFCPAITDASTKLTSTGAMLNGAVNPNGCTATPTATLTTRSVSATSVQVNQPFTVSATLSVSNATADHAGISISFPSLTNSGISDTPPNQSYNSTQGTISTASSSSITGGSTLQYYGAGELLTCSPSSTCPAQHLLVEGDWVSVGVGNTRSLNLTVTPKATGTFRVRIRGWATAPGYQNASRDPSSGSTDQQSFPVYEITVTVQQACNAPGAFSLSSPSDGQSFGSTTTSVPLSWGASANADSYDVYFGTSSNPPLVGNQPSTSRTVSVTPGQTYFWKVVAKVNCGSATATAGVWSFSVQGTGGGAGTVQFSSATYSVNENDGSRTITLTRSGGAGAFVVNYRTSNGTATGADYTGLNEVMSFATNETSKTFNVPIINDTLVEGNETVNLSLSNPSGGVTLGSPSTAILTIVDNDTGCTYSISSSENTVGPGNGGGSFLIDTTSSCSWSAVSDSTSWLTTSSSGSGDGRVSYNFTANPNTSPRTGRITVGGQVSTITQIGIGGAGSVQFNSTSYSANENGGDVTITVTRTGGNETGTVMYSTSNGSATGGSDYTTASGLLLFGENQMSKSFIVPILDDTTSEGNETINLALTNPALSFTLGSPSTATLTITDDEISSTTPPVILLEEGTTNRAAALDAITWLKAPFKVLNFFNFTSDNHTRVMLFTSDLAMTQPDSSQLTVRAGGVALTVENVGPIAGVTGMSASYIIVRLPDGLPSGDLPVVVTLRGLASVNSPTLAIASSGP